MRSQQRNQGVSIWAACLMLMGLLALGGCTTIKLVADYDAATYEEILRVSKEVDKFYGLLLETPENSRSYKNYSVKYVELEASIRSMHVRNLSRPLNKESTKITKNILDVWIGHKDQHQAKDTYTSGNAKLDRKRLQYMFVQAATAEEAKKPGADDK